MNTAAVLILLPFDQDPRQVESVVSQFIAFRISFSVRLISPERAPEHLQKIIEEFERQDGEVIMCLGDENSLLATFVEACSDRPVLVQAQRALSHLTDAALRIMACKQPLLREELRRQRLILAMQVLEADRQWKIKAEKDVT